MSLLEYYARKAAETRGLLHQSNLSELRTYLKTTKTEEIIEAIERIEDPRLLRTLWEAGLNKFLQEAVLKRMDELL